MDRLEYLKLEEQYCYKCPHFYEGTVCGYELSAERTETFEEMQERRKQVCELDKNVKFK